MDKNTRLIVIGLGLSLVALVTGFIIYKKYFTKKVEEPIIEPTPLKTAIKQAYDNLLFATNKAIILEVSYPYLIELANALKDNPIYNISLIGHTDNLGTDISNQVLSEQRAKAVADFLIAEKVPISRIKSTGKGESMPITKNDTKENRDKNRRVEFIITIPIVEEIKNRPR
jgi:outer membrane protein OmpA-like peptidoglycan-associated protein